MPGGVARGLVSGLPGELKKTGKLTGAIDTSWAEGVGSGGGESSAEIATGMGAGSCSGARSIDVVDGCSSSIDAVDARIEPEGEPTGPTEPPERIDPTDAS